MTPKQRLLDWFVKPQSKPKYIFQLKYSLLELNRNENGQLLPISFIPFPNQRFQWPKLRTEICIIILGMEVIPSKNISGNFFCNFWTRILGVEPMFTEPDFVRRGVFLRICILLYPTLTLALKFLNKAEYQGPFSPFLPHPHSWV